MLFQLKIPEEPSISLRLEFLFRKQCRVGVKVLVQV